MFAQREGKQEDVCDEVRTDKPSQSLCKDRTTVGEHPVLVNFTFPKRTQTHNRRARSTKRSICSSRVWVTSVLPLSLDLSRVLPNLRFTSLNLTVQNSSPGRRLC